MSRSAQLARALELSRLEPLLRQRRWRGLVALNYHRIGDPRDSVYEAGVWTTTAEAFDRQVQFAARHFDLVGPDEALQAAADRRPGRRVMITFDDGYRDNHEMALPILRSHGARATFFVTSGFIDTRRLAWWDEISWIAHNASVRRIPPGPGLDREVRLDPSDPRGDAALLIDRYKRLPGDEADAYLHHLADASGSGRCEAPDDIWMTWDMVRNLSARGMSVGAHTVTHPVLANQPAERQQWELATSKRRLEEELRAPVTAFSYPEGTRRAFDGVTRDILRAAGFRVAFSFYGGYSTFSDWDPLDVRRTTVGPATPHALFKAMLTLPRVFVRSAADVDPSGEANLPASAPGDDDHDAAQTVPPRQRVA